MRGWLEQPWIEGLWVFSRKVVEAAAAEVCTGLDTLCFLQQGLPGENPLRSIKCLRLHLGCVGRVPAVHGPGPADGPEAPPPSLAHCPLFCFLRWLAGSVGFRGQHTLRKGAARHHTVW